MVSVSLSAVFSQLLHKLGTVCEKQLDLEQAKTYYLEAISRQTRLDMPAQKLQVIFVIAPFRLLITESVKYIINGFDPTFLICFTVSRMSSGECYHSVSHEQHERIQSVLETSRRTGH